MNAPMEPGEGRAAPAQAAVSPWRSAVDRTLEALESGDDAALVACDDALHRFQDRGRRPDGRGAQMVALYRSLIVWKRERRFEAPFQTIIGTKIQLWELDAHSTDLDYQRRFVSEALARFGSVRVFDMFDRLLALVGNTRSTFRFDRRADIQLRRRPGAKLTILGCSGLKGFQLAGVSWELFDRVVGERLNANLIVLNDQDQRLYLAGLRSLGDYGPTVTAIHAMLAELGDTHVVATGGSAGVFGAINFAVDLGIRHVVAMAGPTSLELGEDNENKQVFQLVKEDIAAGRFPRPQPLPDRVNNSRIERIDYFVAGGHVYDMAQMHALADHCSVVHPHVYEMERGHVVVDFTISDGSIFTAFEALIPPDAIGNGLETDGKAG